MQDNSELTKLDMVAFEMLNLYQKKNGTLDDVEFNNLHAELIQVMSKFDMHTQTDELLQAAVNHLDIGVEIEQPCETEPPQLTPPLSYNIEKQNYEQLKNRDMKSVLPITRDRAKAEYRKMKLLKKRLRNQKRRKAAKARKAEK